MRALTENNILIFENQCVPLHKNVFISLFILTQNPI